MSADDPNPRTVSEPSMSTLSLYLPFKSHQEEDRVTTQDETHLKDSSPAPEDTFGEGPPGQVFRTCCSSRDAVNPSAQELALGAVIGTVGSRRWVFNTNTKMLDYIKSRLNISDCREWSTPVNPPTVGGCPPETARQRGENSLVVNRSTPKKVLYASREKKEYTQKTLSNKKILHLGLTGCPPRGEAQSPLRVCGGQGWGVGGLTGVDHSRLSDTSPGWC